MKRSLALLVSTLAAFAAYSAEKPRHLFNADRPLTEASSLTPREIALDYIRSLAGDFKLTSDDLDSLFIVKEYQTAHNGVTHLVFKQRYAGVEVQNAEWVVNVDRDGRVLNAGGTLVHPSNVPNAAPSLESAHSAVRAAVLAVNPNVGETFYPMELETPNRGKYTRFHKDALGQDVFGKAVWYEINGSLEPAWTFAIVDTDQVHSYDVVVEASGNSIMEKEPTTYFQSAPPPPRGLVFETESPQTNPTPGVPEAQLPAYRERTLQSFAGDPKASPRGWVDATETAGNNIVAGENREAIFFLTTPKTAKSPTRDFSFPLQLGPDSPNPAAYADAATTNAFYWANKAHDLHYLAGFDEQAGNYQQDNFGRGGTGGDPMYVYTHFGITDTIFPDIDNSFYTTRSAGQDGAQSMLGMFEATFGGTVWTDGALDAGVIVHEYTHGVSTRLVRQLVGAQGGAMGEAWSDFFALEYTLPEGVPVNGSYPVGEYFAQSPGLGIRTRPYSTDMNVNPLTYANMGSVYFRPEVHADGEIWVEALWEARAALIGQFGEKEGRRRIRMLVIDGMKLSPPAPSMVDARDAILLADRVDFKGESQTQLWTAFAKRGLGAIAQSTSANSTHVAASLEVPSNTGTVGFYETSAIQGEAVRVVLADTNLNDATAVVKLTSSSGDLEDLLLNRKGSVYTGVISTTTGSGATQNDGVLELIPGDAISAYYFDQNADGAAKLISRTIPTKGTYSLSTTTANWTFGTERSLGLRADPRTFTRFDLPFAFPFFGKTYRSLRLYNNGLLVFELPPAPTCIDTAGLNAYAAIAPMWMEIRTNGSAQKNEGVYVSMIEDSAIVFRWAAETASTATAAVPVSFAATLYMDGRIRFTYGPDNVGLANPSVNTGCGESAPVVGISSGTGYSATVSGYSRAINLQNARTLFFNPPFSFSSAPTVTLETPKEGETQRGILSGAGIVYDTDAAISAVYVLVDGVNVGRATLSVSRPDFCATQTVPGCPRVGFTFNFDVAALGLTPGEHSIRVRAVNNRFAFTDSSDKPVTFAIGEGAGIVPKGAIETPVDGAVLGGQTHVKGYAYLDGLRIVNVDLLIDGITYGNITLNQRRDDICAGLNNVPNCPNVGFDFTLDTTASFVLLPNGSHVMQIRVQDETGRFSTLPDKAVVFTVNNEPSTQPTGGLTTPKNNDTLSGTVHISGFAYDPGDVPITAVRLLIDEETRASLTYGGARDEQCAALPHVKLCPNIGFDGDFDTRLLNNGPHVFSILVFNSDGVATVLPGPVGGLTPGIAVNVQN